MRGALTSPRNGSKMAFSPIGVKTFYIGPSGPCPQWGRVGRQDRSPWENFYKKSFNGKRGKILWGEIVYTLKPTEVLIKQ